MVGLSISRIGIGLGGSLSRVFNLSSLFENGEKGVIFDPSRVGTLYQTTAMQIPARVGDPVGMMLDQSQWGDTALGDLYGPELVTNGFTLHTSRTAKTGTSNGSLNYTDGVLTINRGTTDAMAWPVDVVAGAKPYLMTFTVAGGAIYSSFSEYRGVGTYTFIVPSTQEPVIWPANPSTTAVLKDISIREITVAAALDPIMGPELVTNGGFDTDLDNFRTYGTTPPTIATAGSQLVVTNQGSTGGVDRVFAATIGKQYLVTATYVGGTATSPELRIGPFGTGNVTHYAGGVSAGGTYSAVITATHTNTYVSFAQTVAESGKTQIWNDLSVREIPGHHATQATAAKRPTYGIHPKGGVRNLLTYSEDFGNAVWIGTNRVVAADTTAAPNGELTADTITETASTGEHNAVFQFTSATVATTVSVYVKAKGRTKLVIRSNLRTDTFANVGFDLSAGIVTFRDASYSANIVQEAGGWFRCSITVTPTSSKLTNVGFCLAAADPVNNNGPSYSGDGTSGLFVWGAQLETGTVATPYQKVVSKYEVTETTYTQKRNLLTYTEDFANVAWGKSVAGISVNTNAIAGPFGDLTADTFTFPEASGEIRQVLSLPDGTYTFSAYVKGVAGESVTFGMAATTGAVDQTLTFNGAWQRVVYTATVTGLLRVFFGTWGSTKPVSFSIWGGQLEKGPTATDYQRIDAAFVYELISTVPSVHYLSFDGVDDQIVANTTNPATVDMTYAIAYDSPATDGGVSLMLTSPALDSVGFGGTFDVRYDGNWQFIGTKPSPNVPHVLLIKGKNGLHQTYADEVLLHSSTPATTSKARSEINLFGNSIAGKLYGFVAVQKFSDEDEDQSINKILRSRMGIADKTGETL